MNIGKHTSVAPTVLLVLLAIATFFLWSEYSILKMEIGDLTLREIEVRIENKEGQRIEEASITVQPMYSFDEVKPKHTLTILGNGHARLSVVFTRSFRIQVGAIGYKSKTIEYEDSGPSELQITLEPN